MDQLDPVGDWKWEFHFAQLQALILNIVNSLYRDPKKSKPTPVNPLDLMIDWGGGKKVVKPTQSVQVMKQMLMTFAKEQNAKVEKQNKRNKPPTRNDHRGTDSNTRGRYK